MIRLEPAAPGAATPLPPHPTPPPLTRAWNAGPPSVPLACAATLGFQGALGSVGDAGPRPSALHSRRQGTTTSPHSCPGHLATVPRLCRTPVRAVPPDSSPGCLPGYPSPQLLCKAVSVPASLRPASAAAPGP